SSLASLGMVESAIKRWGINQKSKLNFSADTKGDPSRYGGRDYDHDQGATEALTDSLKKTPSANCKEQGYQRYG
ncbi:hypothetical protein SK128_005673, partial [Halocaridina rubra]